MAKTRTRSRSTGGGRWVELLQGRNNKWYFHVKAPNGEITGSSQMYASRQGARRAIRQDQQKGLLPAEVRVIEVEW